MDTERFILLSFLNIMACFSALVLFRIGETYLGDTASAICRVRDYQYVLTLSRRCGGFHSTTASKGAAYHWSVGVIGTVEFVVGLPLSFTTLIVTERSLLNCTMRRSRRSPQKMRS